MLNNVSKHVFFLIIWKGICNFAYKIDFTLIMKRLFLTTASVLMLLSASAQSGTNSPYSMYGLGVASDQSNGYTRGMNGVGIAFHDGDKVNYLNPASYSAIDSITFVFDVGMSLQKSNLKETYDGKTVSKNVNNADIDYIMGSFRAIKGLGVTFGFMPFSNVGYNFSQKTTAENNDIYSTNTYSGNGGVHEVFIGAGWATPLNGLSIGANLGYLWGDITRNVLSVFNVSNASSLAKTYEYKINGIKLSLGAQYDFDLNKKDHITIGATYRLGNNLSTGSKLSYTTSETSTYEAAEDMSMPAQIGLGVGYNHNKKWRAGLDYTWEKWENQLYPVETNTTTNGIPTHNYVMQKGLFSDRHKINFGGEYCQNEQGRSFLSRMHYRAGISYATPYLKINGKEGPDEIAATIGLGFPIMNSWLSQSKHYPFFNISAQWVRSAMKDGITDNTFRVNVGITLNERWFAKWKFD